MIAFAEPLADWLLGDERRVDLRRMGGGNGRVLAGGEADLDHDLVRAPPDRVRHRRRIAAADRADRPRDPARRPARGSRARSRPPRSALPARPWSASSSFAAASTRRSTCARRGRSPSRRRRRAPVVFPFWVIQNADVFILSRVDLGDRAGDLHPGLAARPRRLVPPAGLPHGDAPAPQGGDLPGRLATSTESRPQKGQLLGYFTLLCIFAVLVMILLGEVIVEIAPPEYADAAPLIPFAAAAFVMPALLPDGESERRSCRTTAACSSRGASARW